MVAALIADERTHATCGDLALFVFCALHWILTILAAIKSPHRLSLSRSALSGQLIDLGTMIASWWVGPVVWLLQAKEGKEKLNPTPKP